MQTADRRKIYNFIKELNRKYKKYPFKFTIYVSKSGQNIAVLMVEDFKGEVCASNVTFFARNGNYNKNYKAEALQNIKKRIENKRERYLWNNCTIIKHAWEKRDWKKEKDIYDIYW